MRAYNFWAFWYSHVLIAMWRGPLYGRLPGAVRVTDQREAQQRPGSGHAEIVEVKICRNRNLW